MEMSRVPYTTNISCCKLHYKILELDQPRCRLSLSPLFKSISVTAAVSPLRTCQNPSCSWQIWASDSR